MRILIVAEHAQHSLSSATDSVLAAAQQLGDEIDLLIIGKECDSLAKDAAQKLAVKRVLVADALEYQYQLAENTAALIAAIAPAYTHLLMPATTFGKNILPRVAALLDVDMVSDVIKIVAADTFIKPIYANNAYATVQSSEMIKLLTVRTTAFSHPSLPVTTALIENITLIISNSISKFMQREQQISLRPDLTTARVVISGGRGLKNIENFKLLEAIADQLGAAIGATRAAVDAGFASNEYQIGQTGKVVAPELYIAIGISGAIQHLAGMKDSKVIVAINNDPNAPIFNIADYGLVADLFTSLAELKIALGSKNED